MNEAEDKELDDEIRKLQEENRKLDEGINQLIEEAEKREEGLLQLGEQIDRKIEELNEEQDVNKEQDVKKRVEIWGEFKKLHERYFVDYEQDFDENIKFFKRRKDYFKNLIKENKQRIKKLYRKLNGPGSTEKMEIGLRKQRGWLEKIVTHYQKAIDYTEDLRGSLKKISEELMEAIKKIEKKLKWKAEKTKELEEGKDAKKKQRLQDEINKAYAEERRAFDEFNEKMEKFDELRVKRNRKAEGFNRLGAILDYAKDDEGIYVDIFIELQEMNEVTRETAKIQERTEKIQNETARILERIAKNTSTFRQFVLIVVASVIAGLIIHNFFSN